MSTEAQAPGGYPSWWRRLVVFATRGNGQPGSVHLPLRRLGGPGWAWRLGTWALVAADLLLLTRSMWGYAGFFVVFPLLWLVHTKYWAASLSLLVFGAGVAAADAARGDPNWWQIAVVTVLVSLMTGTWMTRAQMARADALEALAAKDAAMSALARTQDELVAAEHAAGAAIERERWAREVHDTLAQGFVSVVTLSQAALAEVDGEPGHENDPGPDGAHDVRVRLAQIEEVARDNLTEARALVEGQAPGALRENSLEEALRRLVGSQGRHGLTARLSLDLPVELPATLQVVVLRLVQESLSNVARHARAERAQVRVAVKRGELVVSVQDDGIGAAGTPEGAGLTGMRSRVEALGGRLSVSPWRAEGLGGRVGTVVEARMPL